MTLDEAIKHCKEVAHEKRIESGECISVNDLENAEACYECGEDHKQLAEWLTELKTLRKNRWISCSERLPELNTDVLVYATRKDGIGKDVIVITQYADYIWFGHRIECEPYWKGPVQYFHNNYEITHWMPLPEPPEKE